MGRPMRQTAAKSIFSYWQSITGDAIAPARIAIQPRALKSHLPDLFILERLDRAVFAFRLAGTRLCARYGRELRDHDFVRLWPSAQQGFVLEALHRCLQTPQPVKMTGFASTLDGAAVAIEILLLPLADADGQVTRILGAMLPANDLALREGAIFISQTIERIADADEAELGLTAASVAFAGARETNVSFLRVIDGAADARQSVLGRGLAGQYSDAV